MKASRSRSAAPPADRAAKEENTRWRASGAFPPQIPKRWRWHYQTLSRMRDQLIKERGRALSEAAKPVERHSLHQADSATDEFDHEFGLSPLSRPKLPSRRNRPVRRGDLKTKGRLNQHAASVDAVPFRKLPRP